VSCYSNLLRHQNLQIHLSPFKTFYIFYMFKRDKKKWVCIVHICTRPLKSCFHLYSTSFSSKLVDFNLQYPQRKTFNHNNSNYIFFLLVMFSSCTKSDVRKLFLLFWTGLTHSVGLVFRCLRSFVLKL
jgi:hypothetical protein